MNKLLLGASLLAGFSAVAVAPAMAQVTGYVGAGIGSVNVDPPDTDVDVLGIEGSIAMPIGQGLTLQGNLAGAKLDDPLDGNTITGSANFGMRNANYALGAYVVVKDNEFVDDTFLGFGGEYVYYMPQITLSAGAGFGSYDDADTDVWGVSGVGRYFVSDNLRLDAKVGYSSLENTFSELTGFGFGVGAEWKPDNFPISIFGGYDVQSLEADSGGGADSDVGAWTLGVRFDFGNGTLKARDRSGPAFRAAAGLDAGVNTIY